jgi:hypothetical protein
MIDVIKAHQGGSKSPPYVIISQQGPQILRVQHSFITTWWSWMTCSVQHKYKLLSWIILSRWVRERVSQINLYFAASMWTQIKSGVKLTRRLHHFASEGKVCAHLDPDAGWTNVIESNSALLLCWCGISTMHWVTNLVVQHHSTNSIIHQSNTLIHHFASNWIVCVHLDGDEGWIDKEWSISAILWWWYGMSTMHGNDDFLVLSHITTGALCIHPMPQSSHWPPIRWSMSIITVSMGGPTRTEHTLP